jgi:hypothetical protein
VNDTEPGEYLLAIVVGMLSSLIASLIFSYILMRLRPRIAISNHIAKGKLDVEKEVGYGIKILNKTRSSIVNVEAHLYLIKPTELPDGEKIRFYEEILLKRNRIPELSEFGSETKISGIAYTDYDWIFVTYEDLERKLENPNYFLQFSLWATHSISGFSKHLVKTFSKESIREGEFKKGNSLEIITKRQ